jgi:TonB family protein
VVRDQLGGTIPKVTLQLTHTQTGAKHEVISNEAGAFEFVGLRSGNYTLVVKAMGFKALDRPLQFAGGQTLRQEVTLEVGTLQETITVRDGPASPTVSRRQTSAPDVLANCSTQPNSGGIKPPMKVQDRRPAYPGSMRGTDTEGRVELAATIGVDGAVKTIQTIEATNVDFELSAQEAVRGWRFTPTLLNCVPIEVEMKVLTTFRPEGAASPPPPPPPPPPAPPAPAVAPAATPAPAAIPAPALPGR